MEISWGWSTKVQKESAALKTKKSGAGGDSIHCKTKEWIFYDQMSFLKNTNDPASKLTC